MPSVERQSMNQAVPAYSCLISLYAKENPDYLPECLDCIIGQTIPPEEILVVKDGPLSDELESILSHYSDSYPGLFSFVAYQDNKGLWYALRQGVPACRNELIMRMDADDWSVPTRAERELEVLMAHPEVGCVGSLVTEFEGDISNPIAKVDLPERQDDIIAFGKRRCPYRHPTLMFKQHAVIEAGNYQEMPYFEDYDLYMRMAASGCVFYNVQETLVFVRTSRDFYARRGGAAYLRNMLHFKGACLKRGNFTLGEYVISTAPHIVACIVPNSVREFIYRHFLRSPISQARGE